MAHIYKHVQCSESMWRTYIHGHKAYYRRKQNEVIPQDGSLTVLQLLFQPCLQSSAWLCSSPGRLLIIIKTLEHWLGTLAIVQSDVRSPWPTVKNLWNVLNVGLSWCDFSRNEFPAESLDSCCLVQPILRYVIWTVTVTVTVWFGLKSKMNSEIPRDYYISNNELNI